jgi:hypothetical protein
LVYAVEISVIARIIKPVIVVRQDVPSVVETLTGGATVDFDPVEGVTEVVCDGKTYVVLMKDIPRRRPSNEVGEVLSRLTLNFLSLNFRSLQIGDYPRP